MKGKSASLGDAVVARSLMEQTSSRSLELWLSDLRDVAYDAEDIIDELTTEARRRQITEDPDAASPTCKFSTKMEFRLKSLTARLEEAVAMKDVLSLVENDRGIRERPRTNSLVDESCVYGRECDKEIVLHLLMNDSDDGVGDSSVVSIVGMAGVGKTTLAQLVYTV
ncbi:hypothetical protein Gohar_007211 [Gossypium harknessii]|uniref:Rx N-terminal domain-containing protein n=1 Tax=Gossypium harknessii TaxID=34285 RepID=A0A7J9GFT8_9ROSI|nr:hypothetical protein [Gossypium harknessii]